MDTERFRRAIRDFYLDFVNFRQRAVDRAYRSHSEELLVEAVEKLEASMEQLRVAGEELDRQNEELVASRQSLEAERQRSSNLFESAPDAYLVTDVSGTVREANQMAYRLFSAPAEYLEGKPLVAFTASEDRRSFRRHLNQLPRSDIVVEWETRMYAYRKARSFYAAVRVTLVRDRWGSPKRLHWLVRDVTERRQAEEEIRRLNAELETKMHERTAQLEVLLKQQQVLTTSSHRT